MSRAEIAAAAFALRKGTRRRSHCGVLDPARTISTVAALVADCAAMVRAEPTYRFSLVMHLQDRIDAGTYARPANDIAEQLLGRLMAAELPA